MTGPDRETGEFDAVEFESSPAEYQVAERHLFGLAPTAFVAALAALCVVAAIVLFALGSIVVAVLVLLGAVLLGARSSARVRWRASPGPRCAHGPARGAR